MAAPSTKNVAAGKPNVAGGVYYVAGTTALPTDASTALAAPILAGALGYVSDGGIRPSRDTSIEKVKAWGGDVIAALASDDSRSFEFTLYEVFSEAVNRYLYGAANVTVTAATASAGTKLTVLDKAYKPDDGVLIFDMKYGAKKRRVVVPIADSTVTGEEPYADGSLMAYTVQVEAKKDASGVRVYDYLENDDKL